MLRRSGLLRRAPAFPVSSVTELSRLARHHLILWLGIAVALVLQSATGAVTRELMAVESLVILILGTASLTRCTSSGFWSPAAMFLLITGLFHASLAVNVISGIDPEFPRRQDYVWFSGFEGLVAFQLTVFGLTSYVVGALFFAAHITRERRSGASLTGATMAPRLATVGAVVLLGATLSWFALSIAAVGPSGLVGSYQTYLAATRSTGVANTYQAMGVGLGLIMVARPKALGRAALWVFALFAVIGFFLGLRGEVLFPAAVAASVLAARRVMPRVWVALVGALVMLALINAARQIRQLGVADTTFTVQEASPLAGLVELGSTLRVVATVVDWHERQDEPFMLGSTYTVSFVRFLESMTLGAARTPAAEDFRLFNSEIIARAGGIGGSIIGEAYHNFSWMGVVLVMGVLGAVFMRFSRANLSPTLLAVYVACAVPLYNHIRNSFVPVPSAIIAGLLLVWVVTRFPAHQRRCPDTP